jgi:uncharacterized membrane protein
MIKLPKIKTTGTEWLTLFLVVVTFILGLLFYPSLPAKVVSHWGLAGEPDGYMTKFWGAFFLPILSLFLWAIFLVVPRIDPLKKNIDHFRPSFNRFIVTLFVFFIYLYLLTLYWNIGWQFNFNHAILPAFALLFWEVGTLVGKAERNWSIGIRTPWTMSNEQVWQKTHRLGGQVYHLLAIVSLFGLFFPPTFFLGTIILLVLASLGLVVYSYFCWRAEQHKNKKK